MSTTFRRRWAAAGFHADGKLPRFREDDFAPLSVSGPVDGAELVDWPMDYDEMEPYYAAAERVGRRGRRVRNESVRIVAGRSRTRCHPAPTCSARSSPATPRRRLGYHPYRAPTGVNSVEYDGRPPCNNCGFCGYFGCPIDAKGDPVAPLRRRVADRPLRDPHREHTSPTSCSTAVGGGLAAFGTSTRPGAHEVSARHVVLAGGAFETPRLLLRTQLGNPDVVGRFLLFHFQTFVLGIFPSDSTGTVADRSPTSWTIRSSPMPTPWPRRAPRACPFIRGGIVEHGAAGHPIMRGHPPPRRPAAFPAR